MTALNRDIKIDYLSETDSTNSEARRRLTAVSEKGGSCDTPFAIVAHSQTAGRGRMGRSFYSPDARGIYLSVVCPLSQDAGQVTLTSRCAVAVCRAVSAEFNICPKIKWVNDIYINDRKCAGILCEAVNDGNTGKLKYVIIGVGINVVGGDWPQDIRDTAGAILDGGKFTETVFRSLTERFVREILKVIYDPKEEDMDYYRQNSNVTGRQITFTENGVRYSGYAESIDDHGFLMVRMADDTVKTLNSGEITVRF